MDEADPKRRELQEKLLKQIVNLKYDRALDVACGRGLLTELFLMKKYKKSSINTQHGLKRTLEAKEKTIQKKS